MPAPVSLAASPASAPPRQPAARADQSLDFASMVGRPDQDSAPRASADDLRTGASRPRADLPERDTSRSYARRPDETDHDRAADAAQDRSGGNRANQSRADQAWADQARADHARADQARANDSRADQAGRPDDRNAPDDQSGDADSGQATEGADQAAAADGSSVPRRSGAKRKDAGDDRTTSADVNADGQQVAPPVASTDPQPAAQTLIPPPSGPQAGPAQGEASASDAVAAAATGTSAGTASSATAGSPGLPQAALAQNAQAQSSAPGSDSVGADEPAPEAAQDGGTAQEKEGSAAPVAKTSALATLLGSGIAVPSTLRNGGTPAGAALQGATGEAGPLKAGTGKPTVAGAARPAGAGAASAETGQSGDAAGPDASGVLDDTAQADGAKASAQAQNPAPALAQPDSGPAARALDNAAATTPAASPVPTPLPQAATAATQSTTQQASQTTTAVPLHQVATVIASHARSGESRFQVRLHPEDLGRIDVSLAIDATGTAVAHLRVERPDTLDMLRRDQRSLEQALGQAGFKTDSGTLQFSLGDNGQRNASGGSQAWNDARENRGQTRFAVAAPTDTAAAPQRTATALPYSARTLRLGGVDISA